MAVMGSEEGGSLRPRARNSRGWKGTIIGQERRVVRRDEEERVVIWSYIQKQKHDAMSSRGWGKAAVEE
jgi:hypothetical protein